MNASDMKDLLDQEEAELAIEELNHSPWATLRWFAKEMDVAPEAFGPYDTPAQALEVAELLKRQLAEAPGGAGTVRAMGKPIIEIVPLYPSP